MKNSVPTLSNDYVEASESLSGLFAVKMSDGGWSIANGIGSRMTRGEDADEAGWHLPVRFENESAALIAIDSGPDVALFDTSPGGVWARHAVTNGGYPCSAYLAPDAPHACGHERWDAR